MRKAFFLFLAAILPAASAEGARMRLDMEGPLAGGKVAIIYDILDGDRVSSFANTIRKAGDEPDQVNLEATKVDAEGRPSYRTILRFNTHMLNAPIKPGVYTGAQGFYPDAGNPGLEIIFLHTSSSHGSFNILKISFNANKTVVDTFDALFTTGTTKGRLRYDRNVAALPPPEVSLTIEKDSYPMISFRSFPGEHYQVEFSDDLSGGSWRFVEKGHRILATKTTTVLFDWAGLPENHPRRFYRVSFLP